MTDADWTDEELEGPKKKRGLPKWVWGCGCGCSLMMILATVVLLVAGQRFMDPERQWPLLQESLWFEERPTDLELQVGFQFPFQETIQFTLADGQGRFSATVHDFGAQSGKAELEMMFATEPDEVPIKLMLPEDGVLGELEVQGRTVRVLRYSGMKFEVGDLIGPGVRVDLSAGSHHRMLDLRSMKKKQALTDEEVIEFIDHFDVWHDED